MKPPPENQAFNSKLTFQAKAIFNSLGLDTRKLRFSVSGGRISVTGPFKPRRSDLSKEEKLKKVMILEQELSKIPKVKGVSLRLKGATKRNGKWVVS
ncbi:MAG: hypothetical protein D6675_00520 [Gemmatimonadetes bacterium]|nr:MAG: hypothetical protein D6675_00520 [Gemmatimonadota bacterium]